MSGFTFVDDVTRVFIGSTPPGANLAGYTTGSSGINWFSSDWAAHPTAVRIDQDPSASDGTADVLDVEAGAATPGDCAGWVKRALANFASVARAGQRQPSIYMSLSQVGVITNALHAGGVTGGVTLWIADWMNDQARAEAMIGTSYGGFRVTGVQYRNAGAYDMDVFDTTWWATRSAHQQPTFPLVIGSSGPLVTQLQTNLNRWAIKINIGTALGVDGAYGKLTAAAVTAAEKYFGEQSPAGECDQALFTKLAGALPPPPPPPPPPPVLGSHFQLEYYKPQFGWVLVADEPNLTYFSQTGHARLRWRTAKTAGGLWTQWTEMLV